MATIGWTIAALAVLDVAIGLAFRMPQGNAAAPSSMQRYFDYGTSTGTKLRRMVGPTERDDAFNMRIGWLPAECGKRPEPATGQIGVDVYGSSFSEHIAHLLQELEPTLHVENFFGPQAPTSWSYTCFRQRDDADQSKAKFVTIGVLGSALRRMLTQTGSTTSFENPQPFTYPRYSVSREGGLVAAWPTIRSQADLRAALADDGKWRAFRAGLSRHDRFYSPLLFSGAWADASVTLRMIRRAYGQHEIRKLTDDMRARDGFSGAPEMKRALEAMIQDIGQRTRARVKIPIFVLFEDRGFGTTLTDTFAPMLAARGIPYVASSALASSDNPANFISDGHFTPEVERKIAMAVLDVMRAHHCSETPDGAISSGMCALHSSAPHVGHHD
jgi:hypothetical protein